MNDVNHVVKPGSSGAGAVPAWARKPRRPAVSQPGERSEVAALLNHLHRELQGMNEGLIRTNAALFGLVEEMKAVRVGLLEEPSA